MNGILCIAERNCRLSVQAECLKVQKEDGKTHLLSMDDLHGVILEEPANTFTGAVLPLLARKNIPLVLCDRFHQPCSSLFSFSAGSSFQNIQELQFRLSPGVKEKLWQILIREKIRGQAENLRLFRNGNTFLQKIVSRISRKGAEKAEGRAAAYYWRTLALFHSRKRDADDRNTFFNYIYTILYTAFARWICVYSLNPSLGLHHHNKYNPFVLASDLMEPYRPLADRCVLACIDHFPGVTDLNKDIKKDLLRNLYSMEVKMDGKKRNIFDAVSMTVLSYRECLKEKKASCLVLPES